ncbi:MAG: adaptor protein MecA [Catonella sp.]|uniref:adaptor protein MecA n=1 Tax=Catonella sp. TaxID=2382125 RepID=UPI003F9ECD10
MKFIRLNKGTVRCILTAEDMEEYGIGIDDFIEQSDQASDFIHELLERAGAEVGTISKSGMVTLGIMQMPGGKVSITITDAAMEEAVDVGMAERLETLFRKMSQVDKLRQTITEMGSGREDNEQEVKSPEKLITESIVGIDGEKTTHVLLFDTLDDISEYAKSISYGRPIKSDLYKVDDGYILVVHKASMATLSYAKVCFMAIDFGAKIKNRPALEASLLEHGNLLIARKALQVMKNI